MYFDDGLVRLLNVSSIPTTIIADKQGRVASRMNGFNGDKFVDQIARREFKRRSTHPAGRNN